PATFSTASLPPGRDAASSTVTRCPLRASRCAAARPDTPPPTTTVCGVVSMSSASQILRGLSHHPPFPGGRPVTVVLRTGGNLRVRGGVAPVMNASSPRPRHRPGVVPIVSASLLAAVVLGGCAAADDLTAADAAQEAPAGAVQQHAEAVPEDRAGEAADLVAEPGERAVAHTASMSVTVADVDAAVADAKEWVRGAGGYVAAESVDSAAGQNPTAHLTLRVPADSYEEALEEFAALGDRQYLEQRAQDVTEEVADVDSRVASAEAS